MKITNYLLVFMIIVFSVCVGAYYSKVVSLNAVTTQVEQYNQNIDSALEAAVGSVIEVSDGTLHYDKDVAVEKYLNTLYAAFGISDDETLQRNFDIYIPVIAIADIDGLYIRYNTYDNGKIRSVWTQKIPYAYKDNGFTVCYSLDDKVKIVAGTETYSGDWLTFKSKYNRDDYGAGVANRVTNLCKCDSLGGVTYDYVKYYEFRNYTIIKTITDNLSYYINLNNEIARVYGLSYTFQLPESANTELSRTINDITFISVFQGLPLGAGTEKFYNKFSVAGARILKRDSYYLGTYNGVLYYHRSKCQLSDEHVGLYYDKEECAAKGAVPCPYCRP